MYGMLDGLQRLTSDFFLVNTGMAMIYSITHVWHVGWVATPYLGFLLRKHRYGNVFHSVARTSSCSSYCRVEEILHSHRSGLRFARTSSAGVCRQVPQVGRHFCRQVRRVGRCFPVKFFRWDVALSTSSSGGPSFFRQVPQVGWYYAVKFSFVGLRLRRQIQFCCAGTTQPSPVLLGCRFFDQFFKAGLPLRRQVLHRLGWCFLAKSTGYGLLRHR